VPENFVVSEGTRGPALSPTVKKLITRAERAIARSHKLEYEADAFAEKHGLPRYPHGQLPIGRTTTKK
jgi:hypothetical protein